MNVQKWSVATVLIGLLLAGVAMAKSKEQNAKPCSMLTESLVRESLSVPADTSIEQDDSTESRHPNCGYRWRVMSEADEQAARDRNKDKMMDNIKSGRSPNEGINHSLPTHASVRLTVVQFDSAENAQSALESVKSYLIGRARKKGSEPVPWNAVDDVGDKAYYHGSQLSFTVARELIHLDAKPLNTAKSLANRIIE